MSNKVKVNFKWSDLNTTETSYRVYKSTEPFTSENLPEVHAVLDPGSEHFLDEDVEIGKTYYYMFSVTDEKTEVFSRIQKVVGGEFIYALSTSGDFQIIDSDGNRVYRNTVSNLFEDNLNSYTAPYVPQTFGMDIESNFYVLRNNGTLAKFDPFFNKVWEHSIDNINTTQGCSIKPTVFGEIIIFDVNRNHFSIRSQETGEVVYTLESHSFNNNTRTMRGIDIIPTVDRSVVYVAYTYQVSTSNRRNMVYRIDMRDNTTTQILNPMGYALSSTNGYIYGLGFSDTKVETFFSNRVGIYKLDYIGNVINTTSSSNTTYDLVNRNQEEFFAVENSRRVYLRSKATLDRLEDNDHILHSTTIRRMEIFDQDKIVVMDNNGISLYSWKTKEEIWRNEEEFNSSMAMMSISGGSHLRVLTFDEQEKLYMMTKVVEKNNDN